MRTWADLEGTKAKYSYRPCPTCGGPRAKHADYCQRCSPNIMRGESHYGWKGDAALVTTKRQRTQAMFSLGPCIRCGEDARDRHHIDGDTGNNVRENIAILCRRCHMEVDGRMERFISRNQNRRPRR